MRGDQLQVHFRGGQVKLATTGRWHVIVEINGRKMISEQEFLDHPSAQAEYRENVRPRIMRTLQQSNVDLGQQLGGYVELKSNMRIMDDNQ